MPARVLNAGDFIIENCMKVLNRKCPVCDRNIEYRAERERIDADKNNSKCKYCKIKGVVRSEETRQKLREKNLGKIYDAESRKKRSMPNECNPMFGKSHSEETKQKISEKAKLRTRKLHTPETKLKMRNSRIKIIEALHGQVVPNYNPLGCKVIDEYGKLHGYNFQHAENGGEYHIKALGYWVDGYDKENNVVIEYDEPHHDKQKEKDAERQRQITEYLNCKFIRLKAI